ncbi:hypothetical protein GGR27_001797 [Lewinella antarctica]|uniref:Uncharacterized protein n=1 Tax=Neolewinella antarctica TaxID=442734 RepID=A0ABX0XBT7_9BACT|nr:hypothetical protein [Neolewinella antarctica]
MPVLVQRGEFDRYDFGFGELVMYILGVNYPGWTYGSGATATEQITPRNDYPTVR